MRLVVDPRTGEVRLTLPKRGALRQALAWVEGQRDWVERALAALPCPRPIVAGVTIPFEDRPLLIDWRPDAPRRVRHDAEAGALILGGAEESVGPRVLRWLRSEALARLESETCAMAERAGVAIGRVTVGDPRSRWGSCSSSGDIRYSWRLILAPPPVRLATVAHEVAHLRHMNHGADFHALVRAISPADPDTARAWLRREGAGLHRYIG